MTETKAVKRKTGLPLAIQDVEQACDKINAALTRGPQVVRNAEVRDALIKAGDVAATALETMRRELDGESRTKTP